MRDHKLRFLKVWKQLRYPIVKLDTSKHLIIKLDKGCGHGRQGGHNGRLSINLRR